MSLFKDFEDANFFFLKEWGYEINENIYKKIIHKNCITLEMHVPCKFPDHLVKTCKFQFFRVGPFLSTGSSNSIVFDVKSKLKSIEYLNNSKFHRQYNDNISYPMIVAIYKDRKHYVFIKKDNL